MEGKKSDYKIRIWEWFVPVKGFFNYSNRITSSEEPAKSSLLIKYPLFGGYHIIYTPFISGVAGILVFKGLEALVKAF